MKYEYEKRIIAFIDILGFKSKISETSSKTVEANNKLGNLCDALLFKEAYLMEAQQNDDLPLTSNLTQFSDSIVISLKIEDSYKTLDIIALFKRIQINLLHSKILLRGGIVIGDIIHDRDILLGPGLIKAFYLESKCALYPRIVIDPEVLNQFANNGGIRTAFRFADYDYHKTFTPDFDGTAYVDYFNDISEYLYNGDVETYFKDLCRIIKENINSDDISLRIKYLWMFEKLKLSEYFERYKEIYSEYFQ